MGKNIIKWFLLVFVAVAATTQIIKNIRPVEETTFKDGKHFVFFHAKVRCPTCSTMERYIKQSLDSYFKDEIHSEVFDVHILDYESPETKRIVERYKIATATILLFEQKQGEYIEGRNLAESCWKLVGDENGFKKMIKTQVEDFLQGTPPKPENKRNEIELHTDLNLFEEEKSIHKERDKK